MSEPVTNVFYKEPPDGPDLRISKNIPETGECFFQTGLRKTDSHAKVDRRDHQDRS